MGILFIFGHNGVSAVLRGLGDSKCPLYFIAFSTVLNIVLAMVLVGGFHMGVKGAAIATVIAQAAPWLWRLFI